MLGLGGGSSEEGSSGDEFEDTDDEIEAETQYGRRECSCVAVLCFALLTARQQGSVPLTVQLQPPRVLAP